MTRDHDQSSPCSGKKQGQRVIRGEDNLEEVSDITEETDDSEDVPVIVGDKSATPPDGGLETRSTVKGRGEKLVSLLFRLLYDMMLLGFVLTTVLGVVTNNSDKELIRGAAKPVSFLPNSLVKDYYKGNVFQAFRDAGEYENSLFMYYAPWDRESMQARAVVNRLATFFSQTDIFVAAVNCWYPTSDCAKEFGGKGGVSAGTFFPVFIFYPGQLKGVQYRGPLRSDHLIKFVQHCRYPLVQLHDQDHLARLKAEHPSVLLGFTPGTTNYRLDPNHRALHSAALNLLEQHPDRSLTVAITSDPVLAKSLKLHPSHPIRLVTWNSSFVFPNKTATEGARLANWAIRRDNRQVSWLRMPGRKSLVLQRSLGDHALLVFTPYSALQPSRLIQLVRQLVTSYLSCEQTTPLRHGMNTPLAAQCEARSSCVVPPGPVSCLLRSWSSSSDGGPACRPSQTLASNLTSRQTCGQEEVVGDLHDVEVEMLMDEVRGERVMLSRELRDSGYVKELFFDAEDGLGGEIAGLGCESNKTLAVYLVDNSEGGLRSLQDSLGVPREVGPVPVIVSMHEEAVLLGAPRSNHFGARLQNLLVSWHRGEGQGNPGLRSSDRLGWAGRVGSDTPSPRPETGPLSPACEEGTMSCLQEVSRDTFSDLVDSSGRSVVLLYTSSFCAQCHTASHVFHSAQRLLGKWSNNLVFRSVDGARNDLAWQYTALSYPTVLFLPQGRAEESRVFPVEKPLNTTNLVSFVVSNLSAEERLRLALSTCGPSCLARVRLTANQTLSWLARQLKRGREGRQGLQRRIKYVKTVLYVVTAWAKSETRDLPEMSESFYSAILDSFLETQARGGR